MNLRIQIECYRIADIWVSPLIGVLIDIIVKVIRRSGCVMQSHLGNSGSSCVCNVPSRAAEAAEP